MGNKLRQIVRGVLMESLTETEPLWFKVPDDVVNELGIELYNRSDEAYVVEIHFDTKEILIQLYTYEFQNGLVTYGDSTEIPNDVEEYYHIPFGEIPKSLKGFILRRLDHRYHKYL
jgi:hypothetical protein